MVVLFALLPLMLSTHLSGATDHVGTHDHGALVTQAPEVSDVADPIHATGCCTLSCGLSANAVQAAFSPFYRPLFMLVASEPGGFLNFRTKHFRPPRTA
jgi:hypothetical protein